MGVVNVTPDSFSDGGRWADPRRRDRARPRAAGRRRRHPRRRRRVDPARAPPGRWSRRSSPGSSRSSRALAGDGAVGLGRHHARRGGAGRASPPAPRSSTTSPAAWPTRGSSTWSPRRGRDVRRHALARPQRPHAATSRRTTARAASSRRSATSWPSGSRRCSAAGIAPERIVLDPGLGFAKNAEHNWALLRRASAARGRSGFPLLVGAQPQVVPRAACWPAPDGAPAAGRRARGTPPPRCTVLLAQQGVWGLRVHDVRASHDALRALARWNRTPSSDGADRMTDELDRHRDRVLRPPRRLRAREARGTDRSWSTSPWASTPAPAAAVRRLARHRRLRKSRGRGESRRRDRSGRPDRDPGPAASRTSASWTIVLNGHGSRSTSRTPPSTRRSPTSTLTITRTDRPDRSREVPPVTETPNPHIIDADTLTGEMRPIRRAVLSLGSNLGERLTSLQGAVNALADTPDVWVTGVSPVYETEPVDCPAGLRELPQRGRAHRHHAGRHPAARPGPRHRGRLRPRAQRGLENAPRTLDVDLIVVGDRRARRRRPPAAAPAGRRARLRAPALATTSSPTRSSPTPARSPTCSRRPTAAA